MASFTRTSLIKLIELILALVVLIWHYKAVGNVFGDYYFTQIVPTGTAFAYLIILIGLAAGAFMGTPVNRRVDLFYSIVGFALFIVSAILIFKWSGETMNIIKGVVCIVEGILFLADAVLTFRGES